MKNQKLQPSSPFDTIRQVNKNGQSYWSARDLSEILGYTKWQHFEEVIKKAMTACDESGKIIGDHFTGVGKMVKLGSGAEREISDYHLSRYACYLTAMNGDPQKPEIAAAQTYFAVKTREAEIAPPSKRKYTRKPVTSVTEPERIGAPPQWENDPPARVHAYFIDNPDMSEVEQMLNDYLTHMNKPMSINEMRAESSALGAIPIKLFRDALEDLTDFGTLEIKKRGNERCYLIPDYVKPATRAIAIYEEEE